MNKYQKRKSREIKAIMQSRKFKDWNYKQARNAWRWAKRFQLFHPCEDCDNPFCFEPKNVIVFCPERR